MARGVVKGDEREPKMQRCGAKGVGPEGRNQGRLPTEGRKNQRVKTILIILRLFSD